MAPEIQPVLDAADHALLLTPEQIRNRGSNNTNVSFLRKTQYMTSQNARANDPLMRNTSRALKAGNSTRAAEAAVSRDDPTYVKRHIQKGFDIAYPSAATPASGTIKPLSITASEREAWRNPTHPSNAKLKPVSFFPLLPDPPAKTDSNSFISVKFDKPPLPALPNGKRDNRIDVAILHPAKVAEVERDWRLRKEAHDRNPDMYPDPGRCPYDWDFCVPRLADPGSGRADKDIVDRIRRKLNIADARRDDDALYLNRAKGRFEYERIRTFAEDSAPMTHGWRYLAVSLFDPDALPKTDGAGEPLHSRLASTGQGAAAYYYEIGQRMRLKADRVKTLAQAKASGGQAGKMAAVANENSVDGVDVLIREPDPEERLFRAETRALVDRRWADGEELRALRSAVEEMSGGEELDEGGQGEGGELLGRNGVEASSGDRGAAVNGTAAAGRQLSDVEMLDADADADAEGDFDVDAEGEDE